MKHLTFEQIVQFNRNELSEEEVSEVRRHIQSCESCRKKIIQIKSFDQILSRVLLKGGVERTEDCLTDIEKTAYMDGKISEANRPRIERHLNSCQLCFWDIVNLKKASRETIVPPAPADFVNQVRDGVLSKIAADVAASAAIVALWQQITRAKYRISIAFVVQLIESGLKLITMGRRLEEALPMIYNRRKVEHLGSEEEVHDLTIPLPESAGHVKISIRQVEAGTISLSIQPLINAVEYPEEVKVELRGDRYKSPRGIPDKIITVYPELFADKYNISIVWGDKTWEIPLEVEETKSS